MNNMTSKSISNIAKNVILHPVLFSVFWVLYGYNEMAESADIAELFQNLLYFGFPVFLLSYLIFFLQPQKKHRNSIYYFFILVFVFLTEHFAILIANLSMDFYFSKTRFILPLFFAMFALFWWFTRNKKLLQFNYFLNILTLLYCCWELINVGLNEQQQRETALRAKKIVPCDSCPDIFLILTDAYTNSKSLQKYWNYDNTPFLDSMQRQGFYHVENAKGSYNSTLRTMTSMLNMNYLAKNLDKEFKNRIEEEPILQKLNKNEVMQQLIEHGYEMVNLSLFKLQNMQPLVRSHNSFIYTSLNEFLLDKTCFKRLYNFFIPYLNRIEEDNRKNRILKPLEYLKKHTKNIHTKPQFVYLHLLIPHRPFIFDRYGNNQTLEKQKDIKNAYLEQLIFTNKLLLQCTNSIITNNNRPALILLTGDHGFRFLEKEPEKTKESYSTSTFFYFPNQQYQNLYDSMSSVNLFRAILNKAIDAKIPYLPEKNR
jgi:hypothetical protein